MHLFTRYTVAVLATCCTCSLQVAAAAAGMQGRGTNNTTSPASNSTSSSPALDSFLESMGVCAEDIAESAKTAGGVALTCAILSAINDTQVLVPADGSVYSAAAEENWSATAWADPACIFAPVDNAGVAAALRIVQHTRTPFAVRSGGHSPNPGFANIGGAGLLISLAGFTRLAYDAAAETQTSGFGNHWQDVYRFTARHGRIVVGGRTGTVGLGLTLGGGLSHLSNMYGWAVMNIVSYELVLANATVVTASATEHADLFQAVKAGSSNFGIVTHITQRTYPLGKVWGGSVAFPANASEDFMAAVADFQRDGQARDDKAAILPYMAPVNDTILVTFCHLGGVDHPSAFDAFFRLPVLADQTQVFDDLYGLVSQPLPVSVPRWVYAAITMYLDEAAYKGLVDVVYAAQAAVKTIQGGTLLLTPQPISQSMVAASRALGRDPMNVTDRAQLWVLAEVGYMHAADDAAATAIVEDILANMTSYARSLDLLDDFVFLNDAGFFQDPLRSYGEANFELMKAAQRAYDPTGVFQTLLPGGFKLGM